MLGGVIEARHLRVLRAVAATGSFSAAARELGCTQPAVSQQMKALESSAGTPLLIRTGREMRLTQAGEALVRHAAGILAGLTAAEEEVAAIAGLRAGRVRLVSFPSGSSTLVPDRPRRPARRAPRHPGLPGRGRAAALGRDAARGRLRHGARLPLRGRGRRAEEWDDLVVRPLLTDRLVGLVPEGHRLAGRGSRRHRRTGRGAVDRGLPALPPPAGGGVRERGLHPAHRLRDRRLPGGGRPGRRGARASRCCRSSRWSRVRPKGARTVAVEPAVEREIVALTLPDLAQVPGGGGDAGPAGAGGRSADGAAWPAGAPDGAG